MCSESCDEKPSRSEIERWRILPLVAESSSRMIAYARKNRFKAKERASVMCQNCGSVVIIGGERLESYKKNGFAYCDKECMYEDRGRVYRNTTDWLEKLRESKGNWPKSHVNWAQCKQCGKQFVKRSASVCCSVACSTQRAKIEYRNDLDKRIATRVCESRDIECEYCKKIKHFKKHATNRKFCSSRCAKNAMKQRRSHWERTNGPKEYIDLNKLITKYRGKCVQCGCKVTKQDGQYNPKAATIDHVVPLSKGGWHTWNNVQLMCHQCNSVKNAEVRAGSQMMLPM